MCLLAFQSFFDTHKPDSEQPEGGDCKEASASSALVLQIKLAEGSLF